jgi:hypothetical protein
MGSEERGDRASRQPTNADFSRRRGPMLTNRMASYYPAHDFGAFADYRSPDREKCEAISHCSARD